MSASHDAHTFKIDNKVRIVKNRIRTEQYSTVDGLNLHHTLKIIRDFFSSIRPLRMNVLHIRNAYIFDSEPLDVPISLQFLVRF